MGPAEDKTAFEGYRQKGYKSEPGYINNQLHENVHSRPVKARVSMRFRIVSPEFAYKV